MKGLVDTVNSLYGNISRKAANRIATRQTLFQRLVELYETATEIADTYEYMADGYSSTVEGQLRDYIDGFDERFEEFTYVFNHHFGPRVLDFNEDSAGFKYDLAKNHLQYAVTGIRLLLDLGEGEYQYIESCEETYRTELDKALREIRLIQRDQMDRGNVLQYVSRQLSKYRKIINHKISSRTATS